MKFLIVILAAGTAFALPAASPQQKAQPGGAAANCNANAQKDLVKGIQSNLDIQKSELQGVQMLQKMLNSSGGAAKPGNANASRAAFQSQQKAVLKIQQNGIDTRAKNQQLAKQLNSPASAGLDTVAKAQVTEMKQVQGLKGNAKDDAAVLNTLVKEVEDGTKQNQMNKAMAEKQKCK